MAFTHTPAPENATEGVRHFQQLFSAELPEDYHLWRHLNFPEAETAVDFAIFQPKYGVWIVQLNDWKIDQIREIDQEYCVLIEDDKEILKRNPILDAKDHHQKIRNLLLQENSLLHKHGPMEGNLLFPVHHLAVFNHLTKKDLEENGFADRFPPYHIITTDMFENPDNKSRFAEHLLLEKRFPRFYNHLGLTSEQIDAVVNILNPLAGVDTSTAPPAPSKSPQPEAVIESSPEKEIPPEEITAEPSSKEKISVQTDDSPGATDNSAAPLEIEETEKTGSEVEHAIDSAAALSAGSMEELPVEENEPITEAENPSPPVEAPTEDHSDDGLTRIIQQDSKPPAGSVNTAQETAVSTSDDSPESPSEEPVDESVIKSIVDSIREVGTPDETGDLETRTATEVIERTGHVPIAIEENEEGFDAETRVALKKIIELNHQILQRIWSRS